MTDKVQKIREEVEKIAKSINPFLPDEDGKNSEYEAGRFAMVTQIMQIIDSLQEEPVSIWHDSNEEQPNYASTVAIWYPKYKNGEIVSRCIEVYPDRIWAYIDDLLKM
jgi:hypothetical protein